MRWILSIIIFSVILTVIVHMVDRETSLVIMSFSFGVVSTIAATLLVSKNEQSQDTANSSNHTPKVKITSILRRESDSNTWEVVE